MVSDDASNGDAKHLPKFVRVIKEIRAEYGDEVRMFSDSIIIAAKLDIANVLSVISTVRRMQQRFLEERILVRGGISFGKHYSDEDVIYSQALVNAYQLESRHAKSPRILIDHNVIDFVVNHPQCDGSERDRLAALILRDRDGLCFVDFIDDENLGSVGAAITEVALSCKSDGESVVGKLRWLVDYHAYSSARLGRSYVKIEGLGWEFAPALSVQ